MEFDKSKVYTALNADELKVGSKVIIADNLGRLKQYVENDYCIVLLEDVRSEEYDSRFSNGEAYYNLAYLVSEPEEKKLKWTDLVIGDIITDGFNTAMVTHINSISDEEEHIYAGAWWISDKELANEWEKVDR